MRFLATKPTFGPIFERFGTEWLVKLTGKKQTDIQTDRQTATAYHRIRGADLDKRLFWVSGPNHEIYTDVCDS